MWLWDFPWSLWQSDKSHRTRRWLNTSWWMYHSSQWRNTKTGAILSLTRASTMVFLFPSICNSGLRNFFARRYAPHIPVQLWTDLAPKRDASFPETVLTALLFLLHRRVSKGTSSRCGEPCSTGERPVWFLRQGKLLKRVSLWGVLESPS